MDAQTKVVVGMPQKCTGKLFYVSNFKSKEWNQYSLQMIAELVSLHFTILQSFYNFTIKVNLTDQPS